MKINSMDDFLKKDNYLRDDYANLMDIAKRNLEYRTNKVMEEYNTYKTEELKHEVMECIIDRERIYTNDRNTIIKYLSIN